MADLPFVFVDRSLGRIQVPELLRAAGVLLVTLAEHYGRPQDETVEDTTWIVDAANREWISFMKDERIRRRPLNGLRFRPVRVAVLDLSVADVRARDPTWCDFAPAELLSRNASLRCSPWPAKGIRHTSRPPVAVRHANSASAPNIGSAASPVVSGRIRVSPDGRVDRLCAVPRCSS